MRSWLSQKGVNVRNCELLTTSEDARSRSYRITVDPQDFDRVTTDPSVWPNQVGVRRYKQFTGPRHEQRNGENRGTYQGQQRYDHVRSEAGQQSRGNRRYERQY